MKNFSKLFKLGPQKTFHQLTEIYNYFSTLVVSIDENIWVEVSHRLISFRTNDSEETFI